MEASHGREKAREGLLFVYSLISLKRGVWMSIEQQDLDFKWYVGELPELYREYGHCFAIISNKKVIETHDTYDGAIDSAFELRDAGKLTTFIVQEIGRDDSAYSANFASAWVVA